MGLDADLAAYYDDEARTGRRTQLSALRHALRGSIVDLLRAEGRARVLDVGAGPGLDAVELAAAGMQVTALDLAHANAVAMHDRGLRAVTASLYALPVRTGAFDAVWSMSTFVHVPRVRVGDALDEVLRVVPPGAPVAIGTWGGLEHEGLLVPREGGGRFFSLSPHDRWHDLLARQANVERFETFEPDPTSGWEYQFAVLRR